MIWLQTSTVFWLVEELFLSAVQYTVHGVSNVGQTEIYTAEPLVPEPSVFHVGIPIEKLKGDKSQSTDQIPAELLKQRVEKFALRSINVLILFGMELSEECEESIIVAIYRKGDKTDCSNYTGI